MMNNTTADIVIDYDSEFLDSCNGEQEWIETLTFQIIFSILYVIIFIIGILGNFLVIISVSRNSAMRNPTNMFIVNMACSDILICCFSVPFTPVQSFTGKWHFGEVLCKLFPVSQGISIYISTLTMMVIAIDRFVVVCFPYRQRMQNRTCLLFIMVIDLLAGVFVLPYAFQITIVVGFDGDDRCNEVWSGYSRLAYGIFTSVAQIVLPFITIIACYTSVIFKLRKRPQERQNLIGKSAQKQDQELARMKRTIKMLVAMVVIFGFCWLPINTINLVTDLNLFPIYCWRYYHAMFLVCHVIAMSSACYNPFLYGFFNDSFRKEFVELIPALAVTCKSPEPDEHLEHIELQDRTGVHL